MTLGVCYFPEHWPSERWETDVEQMADAGLAYVRMAEFSWARVEPERGEFDFDWLDEAVELVGEYGMEAVLCTPTATPPKWLVDEHPDIRQADADGTPREWGSRRFTCFNSPTYREETERIVRTMTERYADDPHVAGWQADNEYGCHRTVRCYCEDCAAAFREWLESTYGDVETLNEAWGNTFWSQQYSDFEAVDPPGPTPAEHHPSRLLDYYRFANDSVVEYNRLHADLIREANDDWFATHNFMGDFPTLDAYSLSDDLDFLGWDSYPTGFVQDRQPGEPTTDELRAGDPDEVGMNHDIYRGAKRVPFWVLEQQPGDVNWPPHAPQPGAGAMRLWAHHAVAHGADAVLYFRWRRCRQGQEQYHAGLRKQDGSPDRGYRDAAATAPELFDLAPVDAPVALLHDYESLWATESQPHSPDWHYWSHLRAYYDALRARGVQVDVVPPSTDLDGYAAAVAPTLYLAGEDLAAHLADFVADGGHLLLGARTGEKDPHNQLHEALAPGPLADLVGARVARHESLPEQFDTTVEYRGETYDFRTWAGWLDPAAAETRGQYRSGEAAGEPAVVHDSVGDGTVTTVGCWPGEGLADALVEDLLAAAAVDHADPFPDGVRAAERDGYTWVTNFTSDPRSLATPADAAFVVGDDTVGAYDVAVVEAPVDEVGLE
ncbi:beta-galactosidase [Haloarcula pellucida]|uniref:beta-galactosidase n=1 Tax=Haloarcula pellucida TaxID=1427151 RepID=A0A830GIT0_9EURY|nr:beta-galactosidase [Halomicroarcula pellucida]MBX0350461.1 beta-galactosidase [Halomicroarcula pellucida]GGN91158.1 beta-galactosidase [Halomicroarcula pellucida]